MDHAQDINDINALLSDDIIELGLRLWSNTLNIFILKKLHDQDSKRYLASLVPVPLSTQ